MIELRALIGRIKHLTLPCRHTDDMIATAFWGEPVPSGNPGGQKVMVWWNGGLGREVSPQFTASMDAARMLFPARWSWRIGNLPSGRGFCDLGTQASLQCVEGATPELAACRAALMARAALAPEPPR